MTDVPSTSFLQLLRDRITLEIRSDEIDPRFQRSPTDNDRIPFSGNPPPHAASVFGWSSAVFADLAIHASRTRHPSPPLNRNDL